MKTPVSVRLFGLLITLLILASARLATAQAWLSHFNNGTSERFLFPTRVADYNFAAGTWSGTNLPRTGATAMVQDSTGVYVAYGAAIYQYSTTFTGETLVGTASSSVHGLFLDGNLLIAVHSSGLYYYGTIYSRTTRAVLGRAESYVDSLYGAAHAPGLNKLFGSTSGISPADVVVAGYTDAGIPAGASGSPYHGNYSIGSRNWVVPGEVRLINSAGIIYSTSNLTYLGSLGGAISDVAFNGDLPIALRGTELVAFSNTYLEAGKKTVTGTGVAVSGSNAFVFAQTSANPSVTVVPLADIQAPVPGQPVNPQGLAFTPDAVFVDRDANLLLFSKQHLSLFRYSTTQRRYLATLPLLGAPDHAAYSRENHTAYFAYANGLIRKLDLDAASPAEASFYMLPSAPGGLATAGEFVIGVGGGAYHCLRPNGTLASTSSSSSSYYVGGTMKWDPALRRLYHFRSGVSPDDLHYENLSAAGLFTSGGETPYHGDFYPTHPIRVSPDGQTILLGSGITFRASDLNFASPLSNAITDAVWLAGKIVTLREISGFTQLQTWEGAQNIPGAVVRQFNGTPLRVVESGPNLWIITLVQGAPRFMLLDENYDPDYISPSTPAAPSALAVSGRTVDSVSLAWQDNSDNEDGFHVEYRPAGGAWLTGYETDAGATAATVSGLTAGTAYEFRVSATVEVLSSAPSPAVSTMTLTVAEQPVGEPYNLRISRIYHTSITLEWTDNASNETGFRLFRSTSAGGATTSLNVPANTRSYTDSGLTANTTYYYRIQAVNGAITGDLSAQINGRTLTAAAAPGAPSLNTATAINATSVEVKWTDNSTNEDLFLIERAVSPYTSWQPAGEVTFNVTTFTDTAAVPNTTYRYRVRASNTTGSNASSSLTVTTPRLGGDYLNIAVRGGDVYYFAFSGPHRIERYDTAARTWLTAFPMEAAVTALWADDAGVYAAEGRLLLRLDKTSGARTPLLNFQSNVTGLTTLGDILLAGSGGYTTMNRTTGLQMATFSSGWTSGGFSTAPGLRRVFSRTTGVSPSDIQFLELTAAGTLAASGESPYHGTYPGASRTFVFPNEARVVDDAGIVYSTSNLSYTNSLGGSFTDLVFSGTDIPIVLRSDKLYSYSNTLLEAGSYTLSRAGIRLTLSGSDALVFSLDSTNSHGLSVTPVALSLIQAPVPGQPVNPQGVAFTPEAVFVDRDANLLLFSKAHLSLFRYSTTQRRYLATLPLVGVPEFAAYSSQTHTAYFAYATGMIRKMDLSAASPVEEAFYMLPSAPRGITAAGEFIVAAAGSYFCLRPDGTLASTSNSSSSYYVGGTMTWDPVQRRLYHFRYGVSPDDLHYENINTAGQMLTGAETPYHGDFYPTYPIRVSPDGQTILLGSGTTFRATDLTFAPPIANTITDAAWVPGMLVTLREISGLTQLQTWQGAQNTPAAIVRQFSGTPLRLVQAGPSLWAITLVQGAPRFMLLDENYDPDYISPSTPAAPSALAVSGRTVDSVSLTWQDNSDNEDGFIIQYRTAGGAWDGSVEADPHTTTSTVTGLTAGTVYEFRIIATVETLSSAASAPVSATTLATPDQPVGEPYNLRISRIYHTSITLEWADNASNETGFRIFRSTSAGGATTSLNVPANTRSFTDSGLTANTTYYYRIQAVNGAVTGDLSAQVNGRTLTAAAAPGAPSLTSVTAVSATSVEVKWTDNSTNEDRFLIERAVSPFTSWTTAGQAGFNAASFTDTAAVPNTTYGYRVRASNTTGSNVSSYLTVLTPRLGGDFLNLTARAGDVHYFVFSGPHRIERYDAAARSWLTAIPLEAAGTAIWADDEGLYVAEGRLLLRINPADGARTPYLSMQSTITGIVTLGSVLLAGNGGSFTSMNRATGFQLATFSVWYGAGGFSAAPGLRRVFSRSTGVSPSDIQYFEITAAGALASSGESPYHGDYPGATRTFVFPNEARVVDDSGIVYSTGSLTYMASLGGAFDDLIFHGQDIPIVLRDNRLFSYTNALLEAGSYTLSREGIRLALSGSDALVFSLDSTNSHGLTVTPVPLSLIRAPEPGQPVNPVGLPYTPDAVFMDRDDNVLLFSKSHLSVFRWSTSLRKYLSTLPLVGAPEFAAYSRETHTAYFAYAGGMIRKMDLAAGVPREEPFYALPSTANGLAAAGSILAASDASGAWGTHYYILPDGTLGDSADWNYYSTAWTWDPALRRMYFFQDGFSPNDLHYEAISTAGIITSSAETPYHGDFTVQAPIRVSPDGQRVLLGSGVNFNTSDLTRLTPTLPALADAAWSGTSLYTASAAGQTTNLRTWNRTTFAATATLPALTGTPVRILNLPSDSLCVITLSASVPRFHILNSANTVIYDSVRDNAAPSVQSFVIRTPIGVPAEIGAAKILARATDADGDSFNLTSVASTTPRGGTVTLSNGIVRYTPPAGYSGDDSVIVTLTDGRGKSGLSTLTVAVEPGRNDLNPPQLTAMPGGQMQIRWQGIPGRAYAIQWSSDLGSWATIGTVTAGTRGEITFTDTAVRGTAAYYRIAIP